jgi:hypothetical protein
MSRILSARVYLDLCAFCTPLTPVHTRVISGTDRGALAIFFASRESNRKVPSDCYTMAAHRVLGLTAERASHARKCPRCNNKDPPEFRACRSSSTVSGTSMSGDHSTFAILMDHTPLCPCLWYVIKLHNGIVHVLEEFMVGAWATKGRDLRLEVRRIRSGASRDRHGGVVRLEFWTPHCCLAVDVTVTSARTNTDVPQIGARLPLSGSLALQAQQGKVDADPRTSALLGTPSVHSVHDYYPFALEDGGRLAPMAAELVDRMSILVAVRQLPSMGAAHSRSMCYESYVRMQHFDRRSTTFVSFRRFWGDLRREVMQRHYIARHAFLFLGLRVVSYARLLRDILV